MNKNRHIQLNQIDKYRKNEQGDKWIWKVSLRLNREDREFT